ncbi:Reverse transcriptase zinc-binding domain [Sesbania bispinosa]|nr:Reverse transcriptase zinc-binding domain [Sesbania bispinosa]
MGWDHIIFIHRSLLKLEGAGSNRDTKEKSEAEQQRLSNMGIGTIAADTGESGNWGIELSGQMIKHAGGGENGGVEGGGDAGWSSMGRGGEDGGAGGDLWHQALPVNSVRASRGLTQNSICSYCQDQPETFAHCFHECQPAKDFWASMGIQINDSITLEEFRDWIYHGCTSYLTHFPGSLWYLLVTRNQSAIGDLECPSIMKLLHKIRTLGIEIGAATNSGAHQPEMRLVSWNPPL